MPELVLGLLLLVTILGFALYGFFIFLLRLARPVDRQKPALTPLDPQSAANFLNQLLSKRQIDMPTYWQIRNYLQENFPGRFEFPQPLQPSQPPNGGHTQPAAEADSIQTETEDNDEVVAGSDVEVVAAAKPTGQSPAVTTIESATAPTGQVAPWDLPDPPEPTPRRTFGELAASFMLEKNIRWGELASGILIVGSAVGLVVSLRNELRDTIPYFSALLFLLITAAIHGAGIYTLKKWKLRNTSRGTLIIGLLLIPLNIVAACVLTGNETDRRELTDPLLWIAIVVGLTAYTTMAWHSSKCLFRKGQLPIVVAIIGCLIGALLINRAEILDGSSIGKMLYSIPLVLSFLVGTAAFYKRQWIRTRWPERTSNRMFVFLGLASFAFFAGSSLLLMRVADKSAAAVALMPAFSVVCIMTSWLGRIIWKGAGGKDHQRLSLTGLTLHILGIGLIAVSLVVSVSNPTVMLATALIVTIGMILFSRQQREARLLAAAWAAFCLFVLSVVNLSIGELGWDIQSSASQLANALVSGQSGLSLLATGVAVIAFHHVCRNHSTDAPGFMSVGYASGATIFFVGCGLALVASFVNPDNQFDVGTASVLLGIASLALMCLCIVGLPNKNAATDAWMNTILGHGFAVVLAVGLTHSFFWNKTLANWLNSISFSINANLVLIAATHSIVLALVSVLVRRRTKTTIADQQSPSQQTVADLLGEWSSITNVLAFIGCIFLLRHQTGLATAIAVTLSIGWLVLAWVQRNHRFGVRYWVNYFTASTAFVVVMFVAEILTKTEWCPGIGQPRNFLILFLALSIWAVLVLTVTWLLGRKQSLKSFTNYHPRVEWLVTLGLVYGAGIFVAISLIGGIRLELFSDAKESMLELRGETAWVYGALAGIGLATLLNLFKRPLASTGGALVVVWFLAWGFGAEYFADSKAVGTTMRWLLPIGGAVAAGLVSVRRPFRPAWSAARNHMSLSGRSMWPNATTQTLINRALGFVAFVVLCISTIAVGRFLIAGSTAALGGPEMGSWFGNMKKDISYGGPVGIMVGTFLLYAISERRKWLATAGSAVFQYCVILSVVLLYLSPHPKLASSWFVNILQAVSVGMTGYGFVWFYFRDRIEGASTESARTDVPNIYTAPLATTRKRPAQIEIHTLINGLLITALAVLVMARIFAFPDQPGGWINTVGGLLGVFAWAIYGVLAFTVWREQLRQPHRTSTWMWLACWLGLVLTGMVAALVDRRMAINESTIPWVTHSVILWGAVIVCFSQVVLLWQERRPEWVPGISDDRRSKAIWSFRSDQTIPLLFAGTIVTVFAIRGIQLNPFWFWSYFAALAVVISSLTTAGLLRQSTGLGFISAGLVSLTTISLVETDPENWFTGLQPYHANVLAIGLCLLAVVWSFYFVFRARIKSDASRTKISWMPNTVLLLSCIWVLLGALGEWVVQNEGESARTSLGPPSSLGNFWGLVAMVLPLLLAVVHLFNERRKFQVVSTCFWLTGLAIFLAVYVVPENGIRNSAVLCALGTVVAITGLVWANKQSLFSAADKIVVPNLTKLERSMSWQLPVLAIATGLIVVVVSFVSSLIIQPRLERYLISFSPFGVALGLAGLSDSQKRRWLQLGSLLMLTFGAVLVAWADLHPADIRTRPIGIYSRALLVLAGAMFVYGGLISRWVRESDSWLTSLREMTLTTCSLAVPCFAMVLFYEFVRFVPDVGCGTPLAEAIAIAVVVTGMIIGLIVIAIMPKHDPFSFSLNGRMGYVYVAQFVAAMLLVHLYLSMPFLFQIGIKHYWPYIAMILSFGGVGVAHLLEQRNLTVLGKPLFHTASLLPVLVAACIWAIDSKADPSLVMLFVGLAYLMISYTHASILSGIAAILFGNLALWLFYEKFDRFSFLEHPQFWLIPPAISVLVAAQIRKNSMTRQQLGLIRYICIAVIYLSSTSEIFINGIGQQLWPPVVLAILSLMGIMAGMMMQIRAFLYLGSLFLLMAMISMVSHAHQRLDHVWPWWAFGVGTGIAILVMFGLFEKRKNDMREVVGKLNEWDL